MPSPAGGERAAQPSAGQERAQPLAPIVLDPEGPATASWPPAWWSGGSSTGMAGDA